MGFSFIKISFFSLSRCFRCRFGTPAKETWILCNGSLSFLIAKSTESPVTWGWCNGSLTVIESAHDAVVAVVNSAVFSLRFTTTSSFRLCPQTWLFSGRVTPFCSLTSVSAAPWQFPPSRGWSTGGGGLADTFSSRTCRWRSTARPCGWSRRFNSLEARALSACFECIWFFLHSFHLFLCVRLRLRVSLRL